MSTTGLQAANKNRTAFERFILRFKIAWRIIWKEKHVIVLYASKKDLVTLMNNGKITGIDISYAGMAKHHTGQIIKQTAELISDIDILCAKSEFDAMVEQLQKNRKE